MVEEELKMEVREDMRAANMTASIMPRAPEKYIDATVLNLLDALCTCRHQLRDELDEGDVGAAAPAAADPQALCTHVITLLIDLSSPRLTRYLLFVELKTIHRF